MWLLNQTCDKVESSELLQPLPAASVAYLNKDKEETSAFSGKKKSVRRRSKSKEREDKILEGAISCLQFGETSQEVADPELFIGFENGAIGMFRIYISPGPQGIAVEGKNMMI